MGPEAHVDMLSNGYISAGSMVSNLLRWTAVQFSSPSQRLNGLLYDTVMRILAGLGIDAFDPELSYMGARFNINWLFPGMDSAPIHAAFLLVVIPGGACLEEIQK